MTPRARWFARAALLCVASGVALLAIAMSRYPGGTALNAHAPGHSFWLNFLCDLTEMRARNGVANPGGALIARVAMLDLSLAMGLTWLCVPVFLDGQRALAWVIRVAGTVATLALGSVPFSGGWTHAYAIFTSAGAALLAGFTTLVALMRSGGPARRWVLLAACVATTAADSVFYAKSMATNPRVVLPELPTFQRIACLLAVCWMVMTAVDVLTSARDQGRRRIPSRMLRS